MGSTRQRLPYGKGGGFNRSAHSAWPGHGKEVKKEMGKWEMGNGRWDFANIYDQGGKCKVSKKGVGDVYGRVFGGSMNLLGVTWADIWDPLGVAGELLGVLGRLGGALGRLWEGLRRRHGLFGGYLGGHWVSFGGRWWAFGSSGAAWWGHGGA